MQFLSPLKIKLHYIYISRQTYYIIYWEIMREIWTCKIKC